MLFVFLKKNDNSAMWGNYADCHKGVCLIYDTGDEAKLKVGGRHIPLDVRAISYGGESIECNFFPDIRTIDYGSNKRMVTWSRRRQFLL